MRKFIVKFIAFLFCGMFISALFAYIVDPFNVFHVNNIRNNGAGSNDHYIKMKYILSNPERFDTFVFGSSRVGAIHVEKMPESRCYNMTYATGVPSEHLKNINTFIEHGLVPRKIYIGVDSLSYTQFEESHNKAGLTMSYEYIQEHKLDFYKVYLDPSMALQAISSMVHNKGKSHISHYYDYGWWCEYGFTTNFDWKLQCQPSIGSVENVDENIVQVLDTIREIKNVCDKHDIELVLFTNPMYDVTHRASVDAHYYDFLRGLSQVCDFYNFSGINDITINNSNYLDTSHYNAEVGDLMINSMCYNKNDDHLYNQGFGWYVSSANIDALIALLQKNDTELVIGGGK